MSRASNGTYTLPAGNPVVTATVISSNWANTTLSDLATEMTDSLDRSGKGGMLAPLQLSDGLVGAPSLTFATETTTGFYRSAAGQVSLSIAGNQKFLFAGVDDSTGFSMLGKGPVFSMSRSSDSQANTYQIGSSAAGSAIFRLVNTSGGGSLLDLGTNIEMGKNDGTVRFRITVATGNIVQWEGNNNVAASGLMQSATSETGSFTATITGCTTAPTATVNWRRTGTQVTLEIPALIALSNSAACTFTGMTAALSPVRTQGAAIVTQSSGVNEIGMMSIVGGSVVLTLRRANGSVTFVNDTLNKGTGVQTSFTYNLS